MDAAEFCSAGPHRHKLPPRYRVRSKPVLGGLHHEYRLEKEAAYDGSIYCGAHGLFAEHTQTVKATLAPPDEEIVEFIRNENNKCSTSNVDGPRSTFVTKL